MLGRTPSEAYFQFIEPMQRALNFVTVGRLLLGRPYGKSGGESLVDTSFNNGELAPMSSRSTGKLFLRAACRARLRPEPNMDQPFRCDLAGYSYGFFDGEGQELLAFHWNSNATGAERTFPHLHIGAAIGRGSALLPGSLHKIHVPTGLVPVAALVRFAIEELDVNVRSGMSRKDVLTELSTLIERE
jgi:hypothetical protein